MEENFKEKILNGKHSVIAALLLFIFMLSLSGVVYASSYTTYVSFKNPYAGVVRSFDGDNIKYTATMRSSKSNDSDTYTIYLQRASGIWALDVAHKELDRIGYGYAYWSDVGAGNYRLYFYKKSNDGVTLSSDDVVFANF